MDKNIVKKLIALMRSESLFKSMDDDMFDEKIKMYMQKLGISGAGPVPSSLLAEQDLETTTKSQKTFKQNWADMNESIEKSDLRSFSVWYYDDEGSRKCAVFADLIEAEAFGRIVTTLGFKNVEILKANEVQDLEDYANGDLIDNIKVAQIKRQKATILQREKETTKSFKDTWNQLTNKE